jgi:hypothetical protein
MRKIRNQKGFIVSTELMLIATILVIGLVVGLQAVRTAVVTELADVGGAIGTVSQTYSFSGASGHHASSNGSAFQDQEDTCDDVTGFTQTGLSSRCVSICNINGNTENTPTGENGLISGPSTN